VRFSIGNLFGIELSHRENRGSLKIPRFKVFMILNKALSRQKLRHIT